MPEAITVVQLSHWPCLCTEMKPSSTLTAWTSAQGTTALPLPIASRLTVSGPNRLPALDPLDHAGNLAVADKPLNAVAQLVYPRQRVGQDQGGAVSAVEGVAVVTVGRDAVRRTCSTSA